MCGIFHSSLVVTGAREVTRGRRAALLAYDSVGMATIVVPARPCQGVEGRRRGGTPGLRRHAGARGLVRLRFHLQRAIEGQRAATWTDGDLVSAPQQRRQQRRANQAAAEA
jgi:hypothetical protein